MGQGNFQILTQPWEGVKPHLQMGFDGVLEGVCSE